MSEIKQSIITEANMYYLNNWIGYIILNPNSKNKKENNNAKMTSYIHNATVASDKQCLHGIMLKYA